MPAYIRTYDAARIQQNDVPVANAVANVTFNKANKVVSFGSSFVTPCESSWTSPPRILPLTSYHHSQNPFNDPFYLY